jgi:uncharacterized damage-inducible protein DinB
MGASDQTKTSLLFRRVAETVAGEVLSSHRGATPLIFCDHTVSSLLYFEKSFGDLLAPTIGGSARRMDLDRKKGLIPVTADKLSVQVAINSWRFVVERTTKIFSSLPEDDLLKQVAPGRNRLIYLLGHLTAVHDAMFPILGLGERLHPELDAIFVSSPDKAGAQLPLLGELRQYWDEVNAKLLSQFASLSADEWLQRHYAMSEEDYTKDRTRNRLAVLLSRTNHMSYHLGQITLAVK